MSEKFKKTEDFTFLNLNSLDIRSESHTLLTSHDLIDLGNSLDPSRVDIPSYHRGKAGRTNKVVETFSWYLLYKGKYL